MPQVRLHVIADETPFPANYGTAMDLYYFLKTLHSMGVKVQLHHFYQERQPTPALQEVCEGVHAYPVHSIWTSFPWRFPHQVLARKSEAMLRKLLTDQDPVIFFGLRSCYLLSHPKLENRRLAVRTSVLEWEYLYNVAKRIPSVFSRWFVNRESALMNVFQQTLGFAYRVFCISEKDLQSRGANLPAEVIPAFIPYDKVVAETGTGTYCIFHGYLGDPANHEAAMYLVTQVWGDLPIPLLIAGGDPLPELVAAISDHPYGNIQLRHNPTPPDMDRLLRGAQVHVLPAFQPVTFPYKLLISLFAGRHIVASPLLVHRSGLEFGCVLAQDATEMRDRVKRLFSVPFSEEDRARRALLLETDFSNRVSATRILDLLSQKGK